MIQIQRDWRQILHSSLLLLSKCPITPYYKSGDNIVVYADPSFSNSLCSQNKCSCGDCVKAAQAWVCPPCSVFDKLKAERTTRIVYWEASLRDLLGTRNICLISSNFPKVLVWRSSQLFPCKLRCSIQPVSLNHILPSCCLYQQEHWLFSIIAIALLICLALISILPDCKAQHFLWVQIQPFVQIPLPGLRCACIGTSQYRHFSFVTTAYIHGGEAGIVHFVEAQTYLSWMLKFCKSWRSVQCLHDFFTTAESASEFCRECRPKVPQLGLFVMPIDHCPDQQQPICGKQPQIS